MNHRTLLNFILLWLLLNSISHAELKVVENFDYGLQSVPHIIDSNGGSSWSWIWGKTTPKSAHNDADPIFSKVIEQADVTETGNCLKWWTATGTTQHTGMQTFQKAMRDDDKTCLLAFQDACKLKSHKEVEALSSPIASRACNKNSRNWKRA